MEKSLLNEVETPRAIVRFQEPAHEIMIHSFGDVLTQGIIAAVYMPCVNTSPNECISSKAILRNSAAIGDSKERKETCLHLAYRVDSGTYGKESLGKCMPGLLQELQPAKFAWIDSTVTLHWICGNRVYKQFVANQVAKIKEYPSIQWRYVPTDDNLADITSRGG